MQHTRQQGTAYKANYMEKRRVTKANVNEKGVSSVHGSHSVNNFCG
ncbi:hypothetical protein EDO6_03311 [Paenibacillus xylanexedens]|nr:hypothetical protein EDO6_03311 [Paenibacillus xylanexedens]